MLLFSEFFFLIILFKFKFGPECYKLFLYILILLLFRLGFEFLLILLELLSIFEIIGVFDLNESIELSI